MGWGEGSAKRVMVTVMDKEGCAAALSFSLNLSGGKKERKQFVGDSGGRMELDKGEGLQISGPGSLARRPAWPGCPNL